MRPEEIKNLRIALGEKQDGMSQEAFAALFPVSFTTINRWENGKARPRRIYLNRMNKLREAIK